MQQVELRGPGGGQRFLHIWKVGLEDLAEAGHEVVRLPELRDALAIPVLPGGLRRFGNRIGIALDHGDLMAVTREQQRRAKAADAGAEDEHFHGG